MSYSNQNQYSNGIGSSSRSRSSTSHHQSQSNPPPPPPPSNKKSHKKKKAPSDVPPRPPNAWILFRTSKALEINSNRQRSNDNGGEEDGIPKGQQHLSKYIAQLWASENQASKSRWYDLANEKLREHQRRFPDYKYKPSVTEKSVLARQKRKETMKGKLDGKPKIGNERKRGDNGRQTGGNGSGSRRVYNGRQEIEEEGEEEDGDGDEEEGQKVKGSPAELHHPYNEHQQEQIGTTNTPFQEPSEFQIQFENSRNLNRRRGALVEPPPPSSFTSFGSIGSQFQQQPSFFDDQQPFFGDGVSDLASGLGLGLNNENDLSNSNFSPTQINPNMFDGNFLDSSLMNSSSQPQDDFNPISSNDVNGSTKSPTRQRPRSLSRSTRSSRNSRVPYPISAPCYQQDYSNGGGGSSDSTLRSPRSPKSSRLPKTTFGNSRDSFQGLRNELFSNFVGNTGSDSSSERKALSRSQGANAGSGRAITVKQRPRSNTNVGPSKNQASDADVNKSGKRVVSNGDGDGSSGTFNFFARSNPFPNSLQPDPQGDDDFTPTTSASQKPQAQDQLQGSTTSMGMDLDSSQDPSPSLDEESINHRELLQEGELDEEAWGRRRIEIKKDKRKQVEDSQESSGQANFSLPTCPSAFGLPTPNLNPNPIDELQWNWLNTNNRNENGLGDSLGSNGSLGHNLSTIGFGNGAVGNGNKSFGDEDWETFVAETPGWKTQTAEEETKKNQKVENIDSEPQERIAENQIIAQDVDTSLNSNPALDPKFGIQSPSRYEGVSPRTIHQPINEGNSSRMVKNTSNVGGVPQINEGEEEPLLTQAYDPDIIGWAEDHLAHTSDSNILETENQDASIPPLMDERAIAESLLHHNPFLPSGQFGSQNQVQKNDFSMEVSKDSNSSFNHQHSGNSSNLTRDQNQWKNWRPNQPDPMSASTEDGFNVHSNDQTNFASNSLSSARNFSSQSMKARSRSTQPQQTTSQGQGAIERNTQLTNEDWEMASSLLADKGYGISNQKKRNSNVNNGLFENQNRSSTPRIPEVEENANKSGFEFESSRSSIQRTVKERHSTTPTSTINTSSQQSSFRRHSKTPSWSAGLGGSMNGKINFSRPLPLQSTSPGSSSSPSSRAQVPPPLPTSSRAKLRGGSNWELGSGSSMTAGSSRSQMRSPSRIEEDSDPNVKASIDDFSEEELLAAIERRRRFKAQNQEGK